MEQLEGMRSCPMCGGQMKTKITHSNIHHKYIQWICGHCDYVSSGEDIETTSFTPPENAMKPKVEIKRG